MPDGVVSCRSISITLLAAHALRVILREIQTGNHRRGHVYEVRHRLRPGGSEQLPARDFRVVACAEPATLAFGLAQGVARVVVYWAARGRACRVIPPCVTRAFADAMILARRLRVRAKRGKYHSHRHPVHRAWRWLPDWGIRPHSAL